jgi:hypothetical protein
MLNRTTVGRTAVGARSLLTLRSRAGLARPASLMLAALAVLGVMLLSVLASAAQATAPGVAGNIVFQRYLGPDNSQGSIYTISPDGTGERQVTASPLGLTDRFPDFGPHSQRVAFQRCADFAR